ncbi:MAG: 3'-5' exonuclease [Firmicutes bacterium]|nr:3'-5' exonuclease [Bacillota bacterium]
MALDPGQQALLEVIFHYLDVTGRPATGGELRTLVDGFGRNFQGKPLYELLSGDQRFVLREDCWALAKWEQVQYSYTVVDVETTGLSPRNERITEVALVRLEGTEVTGQWSTLVNPGRPIPPYITRLTGIDDAMVADAPPFEVIAPKLISFFAESTLIAHNASFDIGFLNAELRRAGRRPLGNQALDTVTMARRLLPHLPNRKLVTVARYFGISTQGHHRAMADCLMTAGIFRSMVELIGGSLDDFLASIS